jgi:hypothetical protein
MRYDVDPGSLGELAVGLRGVAATVRGVPTLAPRGMDTGSPAVSRALHEVGHDWSRARHRIEQELTALSRATELAAAAYRRADQDVAGACG